jgi:hypothetical protein
MLQGHVRDLAGELVYRLCGQAGADCPKSSFAALEVKGLGRRSSLPAPTPSDRASSLPVEDFTALPVVRGP